MIDVILKCHCKLSSKDIDKLLHRVERLIERVELFLEKAVFYAKF